MCRKLSIKREVFYWGIVFFVIISTIIGVLTIKINYDLRIRDARNSSRISNNHVSYALESAFEETDSMLERLSERDEVIRAYRDENIREEVLDEYIFLKGIDQNISHIYSGYENGTMIIAGYDLSEEFDPKERPWYIAAKNAEEEENTKITYIDINTNELFFSNSRGIYENGGLVGVITVDFSNENMLDIIGVSELYDTKRSFIMDEDWNVIVHPQEKYRGTEFHSTIESGSLVEENGHYKYRIEGREVEAYIREIDSTGFMVATAVDRDEIIGPIVSSSINLGVFSIVISVLLSLLLSNTLYKRFGNPIIELGRRIREIVSGRLPSKTSYDFSNPEIGHIAENVEKMAYITIQEKNRSLEESQKKYKRLIENLSGEYFFYILDKNGDIEYVSPSVEGMLGYTPEEFVNISVDRDQIVKGMSENTMELSLSSKSGKTKILELTEVIIRDEDNMVIAIEGIAKDITDRREREKQIEYLSFHDSLTGFYNRRFFEEELTRLDVQRNYPLSLIYGDINGLKLANDIFGHEVGDKLILIVSKIIRGECREDDIIARIGGDEFAIILPGTDREQSLELMRRIKDAIDREKLNSIVVSISFGSATKYRKDESIEDILKRADERMYEKKLKESPNMKEKTVELILEKAREKGILVSELAREEESLLEFFSERLELSPEEEDFLLESYRYRNIGKFVIDESVLEDDYEFGIEDKKFIRRQPEIGFRILSASPRYKNYAEYILYHRENWNGGGYPNELSGEDIPLISRIIYIVSDFMYMKGREDSKDREKIKALISKLKEGSGEKYDPELVQMLVNRLNEENSL